ncbi:SDR family NAD(P)-dependent oxidoreductase [Microbacterium thalassium]|uniref:2,3-dihydroxy-2,3-dihydrophenylpropionate dehydrogenase n=1 Tax=Microbacterium thalassium TaxID=362649 RepID=A0A7X0FMP1_9MICO|nr:SDR family NAD(P)-dependent oxidoreductase [Microbacterium thalassium]MBB6389816.1 2,3-dihydroxy-2,3-dihydrophenylpropionate dehydrogenase [Microbacterium thalassium]GLK24504.1 3-(cis-5,6-dihydroxycyclohexa-1, 3-dien-1-yl)propanoate dehydrogenase [Microbacterium thalassium]
MIGWLDGDVAFITGGGSGIGRAVALRFLQEGAHGVVIFDRSIEGVATLADEAGVVPDRVLALTGDVRSTVDLEAAVAAALDRFGAIDVLVPNAGIWDFNRSIHRTTSAEMAAICDELFDINVKGCVLTVSAAWRALVDSGGCIVMTLSNAAFYPAGGGPAYTASKHAIRGLVTQLAYELAPKVRVNGVAIGGLRTDLRGPESIGMGERSIEQSFAKRTGEPNMWLPLHDASSDPADSTGPFVLLASRRNASVITGAIINADGGIGVRGFATAAGGDQL